MEKKEELLTTPCGTCGQPIQYVKGFVGRLNCPYCNPKMREEQDTSKQSSDFTKHDQEKVRLELIPASLLKAVGTILTFGAKKYDDNNWRKCPIWSRYYGAMMRHLTAWWDGETLDSESGKSHLWHAACCLTFLIEFEEKGMSNDDRPA